MSLKFDSMSSDKITFYFLCQLNCDPDRMIDWCMNMGLISKNYICPECGSQMKLMKRKDVLDGKQWRCLFDGHDVKRSIRKGSWFETSRLSMYEILMMTYMWCMKIGNDVVIHELGVSSRTVTDWFKFCREVCVESMIRENEMLGGEGIIVELDEYKFGKRKYERGRFIKGKWVFGGVERGTNKCFLIVVPERTKEHLLDIIKHNIQPGTTLISDCWRTYSCLEDEGFHELSINHNIEFKNPETGAHNNSADGTWPAIKRQITTNINKEHFMFEYLWRRRHNQEKNELIHSFLAAISSIYPPQSQD